MLLEAFDAADLDAARRNRRGAPRRPAGAGADRRSIAATSRRSRSTRGASSALRAKLPAGWPAVAESGIETAARRRARSRRSAIASRSSAPPHASAAMPARDGASCWRQAAGRGRARMTRLWIKICGMTHARPPSRPRLTAGADAIGFVFTRHRRGICRSPRARELAGGRARRHRARRGVPAPGAGAASTRCSTRCGPTACRPTSTISRRCDCRRRRAPAAGRARALHRCRSHRGSFAGCTWLLESARASRRAGRARGLDASARTLARRDASWCSPAGSMPATSRARSATVRPFGVDVSSGVESRARRQGPGADPRIRRRRGARRRVRSRAGGESVSAIAPAIDRQALLAQTLARRTSRTHAAASVRSAAATCPRRWSRRSSASRRACAASCTTRRSAADLAARAPRLGRAGRRRSRTPATVAPLGCGRVAQARGPRAHRRAQDQQRDRAGAAREAARREARHRGDRCRPARRRDRRGLRAARHALHRLHGRGRRRAPGAERRSHAPARRRGRAGDERRQDAARGDRRGAARLGRPTRTARTTCSAPRSARIPTRISCASCSR